MKDFSGKTALITGASSGIGEQIAKQLAQAGAHLILVARRTDRLEALADELASRHGIRAEALACDLGRPQAAAELYARTEGAGRRVDILVNNAGFAQEGNFLDLPLETHLAVNQLNMTAVTELAWHFGRAMRARGEGWILNTASVGAFAPVPKLAIYTSGKAYVLSLGEALSEELRPHGVTVTSLCPGGTWTEFMSVAGQTIDGIKKLGMMSAEDVARAGLKGLARGERVVVPGLMYKASMPLLRLLPSMLKVKLTDKVMN
ncbi:MAG: SDR family NAD(P)-dependent oxidoreductase [Pseudomonadota bacterium]